MSKKIHRHGGAKGRQFHLKRHGKQNSAHQGYCRGRPEEPGDHHHQNTDDPVSQGRRANQFRKGTNHLFIDSGFQHDLAHAGNYRDNQNRTQQFRYCIDETAEDAHNRLVQGSCCHKTKDENASHAYQSGVSSHYHNNDDENNEQEINPM